MPIFEHDEEITDEEFLRQQKVLNKKVKRIEKAEEKRQEQRMWEQIDFEESLGE